VSNRGERQRRSQGLDPEGGFGVFSPTHPAVISPQNDQLGARAPWFATTARRSFEATHAVKRLSEKNRRSRPLAALSTASDDVGLGGGKLARKITCSSSRAWAAIAAAAMLAPHGRAG